MSTAVYHCGQYLLDSVCSILVMNDGIYEAQRLAIILQHDNNIQCSPLSPKAFPCVPPFLVCYIFRNATLTVYPLHEFILAPFPPKHRGLLKNTSQLMLPLLYHGPAFIFISCFDTGCQMCNQTRDRGCGAEYVSSETFLTTAANSSQKTLTHAGLPGTVSKHINLVQGDQRNN